MTPTPNGRSPAPARPAPPRTPLEVRLAVLQAAATFCGQWGQAREEIRSEHVLVLAERWLAWVQRE